MLLPVLDIYASERGRNFCAKVATINGEDAWIADTFLAVNCFNHHGAVVIDVAITLK